MLLITAELSFFGLIVIRSNLYLNFFFFFILHNVASQVNVSCFKEVFIILLDMLVNKLAK